MMLDQLRAFLAAAKHLRIYNACVELNLTPTAISKRLAALQAELGGKLYTPNSHGIELTEAGRAALPKITAIVKQADELKESFRRASRVEPQPAVFSVAAAFSLGADFLPALAARFEKAHPGVHMNCQTASSQQVEQMVRAGRADIGLSSYLPNPGNIASEPFRVQTMVFFVNSRHPLARRRKIALADVLAYPLVIRTAMNKHTWAHEVLNQLTDRGFKYRVALECNGPLQVKESVSKNLGVGISFLENLRGDFASGRFVLLKGSDFQFNTPSYILHSKKRALPPTAQEFLNLLRQEKNLSQGKKLPEILAAMKQPSAKPGGKRPR